MYLMELSGSIFSKILQIQKLVCTSWIRAGGSFLDVHVSVLLVKGAEHIYGCDVSMQLLKGGYRNAATQPVADKVGLHTLHTWNVSLVLWDVRPSSDNIAVSICDQLYCTATSCCLSQLCNVESSPKDYSGLFTSLTAPSYNSS